MRSIYKKWSAIAVFVSLTCVANAAADQLVVTTKDGNRIQLNVADVGRVSFGDNIINLHMADGTLRTLSLGVVDNLSFDLDIPTGIESLETNLSDEVCVSIADGVVTLTGRDGVALDVAVYGINGTLFYVEYGRESVSIDFKAFAKGAYVIRANNKTIKYVR